MRLMAIELQNSRFACIYVLGALIERGTVLIRSVKGG